MRKNNFILAFILTLTSSLSFAKVTIGDVQFKTNKYTGKITINYSGNLKDYPEMKISGKTIYVMIPGAKVKESINKSASFSTSMKDTKLSAYQSTAKLSKIKAVFPFSMSKKQDQVSLTILDKKIELTFPRVLVKAPVRKVKKKIAKTKMKKEFLNEDYLNSLLKIDKPKKATKPTKVVAKNPVKTQPSKKDTVKTTLASSVKNPAKSKISLLEYGGKFVAFLGVVLLLFWGVITLMKKGFIKKGKLGFLNNTDQVSVLSQTYIAPKKSLMLIKAHKQVFLVSSTDSGIHPISEIKDVAGLLKDGEKALSGVNFDTDVMTSTEDELIETRVKLKEDIMKSNQESSLTDYFDVKDKVKFSDQIKKKVKGLKPLQ